MIAEQTKGGDRMSAPGRPTAEAGRNQETVLADDLNRMIALAEEARSEETWAFDALSRFVHGCAEARLDPLASVTHTTEGASEIEAARARLLKALDGIVQAGHDESALRDDVGTGDIVGAAGLLVRGLSTVPAGLGGELSERAARLVLAGMRAHPAPVPPGTPLTAEELAERVSAPD